MGAADVDLDLSFFTIYIEANACKGFGVNGRESIFFWVISSYDTF